MRLRDIHVNVWIGLFLIILSTLAFIEAKSFTNQNAMTWPCAVLIVLIILSVVLLIQGIRATLAHADTNLIPMSKFAGALGAFIYMVLYTAVMNWTGYFVSTAIFLPIGMAALGQRNWKVIVGVTIGLNVFIYYMFVVQLALRMP